MLREFTGQFPNLPNEVKRRGEHILLQRVRDKATDKWLVNYPWGHGMAKYVSEYRNVSDPNTIGVENVNPWSRTVEETGVRPHTIIPRHFKGGAGKKGAFGSEAFSGLGYMKISTKPPYMWERVGDVVFLQHVNHPGYKPIHAAVEATVEFDKNELDSIIDEALNEAFERSFPNVRDVTL